MAEETDIKQEQETGKKNSRIVALFICVAIIIAAFAIYFAFKGSCGPDKVHNLLGMTISPEKFDFLVMTIAPQVGNSGIVFTLLW